MIKKINGYIAVLLALSVLLLYGCTTEKISNDKSTSISVDKTNIKDFRFSELTDQIVSAMELSDENLFMPFMYGKNAVSIFFTPSGEIVSLDISFWGQDERRSDQAIPMENYRAVNTEDLQNNAQSIFSNETSPIDGIDVYFQESMEFSSDILTTYFEPNKMCSYVEKMDDLKLMDIINEYVDITPIRYQLVSEMISKDVINNPDVSVTVLDCRNDVTKITDFSSLDIEENTTYLEIKDISYFVLLPYYLQVDNVKGCIPMTVGQTKPQTYVANNLVILLV